MFARFPSPTPFGLGLGSDCPRADEPAPGTLRLSVRGILTPFIAYSFRHPHFRPLHGKVSTPASPLPERSPTIPRTRRRIRGFGDRLESRPLSAQAHLTGELLRTLSRHGCF